MVELGAGLGVPGLLAGRVCPNVLLTDHNPKVLNLLKTNIALNAASLVDGARGVSVLPLDWSAPPDAPKARVVLGADVAYSETAVDALFDTVHRVLEEHEDAVFLLAYVSRWPAVDAAIEQAATRRAFSLRAIPLASFLPPREEPPPHHRGTSPTASRSDGGHEGGQGVGRGERDGGGGARGKLGEGGGGAEKVEEEKGCGTQPGGGEGTAGWVPPGAALYLVSRGGRCPASLQGCFSAGEGGQGGGGGMGGRVQFRGEDVREGVLEGVGAVEEVEVDLAGVVSISVEQVLTRHHHLLFCYSRA